VLADEKILKNLLTNPTRCGTIKMSRGRELPQVGSAEGELVLSML
jgi:hypothetical protein